ncbi:hypothetical protein HF888_12205 [Bermanella marisrubri]|uniref:Lipocalin-like domain-containing protein n=1 Tax=Bermanella marisrubri TaxID=207949 RepID=Q1N315_9GAMM|nr:hypothetical protein [Bermanella marisrubri]EAT12504.1 hypothetical protein RED65_06403 [Oceanobacter sp. RED65] [Bermanella marisrubri]QIZ84935.1 hypothetical protein HF888_12205 [Bermanella marisrubri]
MKKLILLIIATNAIVLSGCIADSTSGDTPNPFAKNIENERIQGEWQSDEFVENGTLVSYSWEFKGTNYVKTQEVRMGSGERETIRTIGTYSSERSVIVNSGVSAKTIDFSFENADGNIVKILDIVYVKDDELYFGNANLVETCEGEYYEITTLDVDILNGQVREFEETTKCYARPITLDFNRAYRQVP